MTDASNLSASAATRVTVAAALLPPVFIIGGPYTGTAGASISFSAAGSSDSQGQALSYMWNFGDNTTAIGISPSHTYAASGTYTVSLTVADTSNLIASATTKVTIAATPLPPVAVVGEPYAGIARLAFSFDGSASSDPQGQTLVYMWNFGDGTTGTGASPAHTYQTTGSFPVSLIVVNSSGLSSTAATVANIVNQGTVYNGLNPLGGVKLYVLAASTTGYGQPSQSLLTSSLIGTDSIGGYIRTQGNGGFTITGDYTCTAGDQVCLYVDGSEFGSGTYMGVLGACPPAGDFAAAIPSITVNQVTTVAAAYSLAGFAADPVHIASSGSIHALSGVANAFATAGTLASIASGSALSDSVYYPGTPITTTRAPQAVVNSLANILVTSARNSSAQAIDIAHHPATNVSQLFSLQSANPPFQPALTSAPSDWTMCIIYSYLGEKIAIDSQGNIWGTVSYQASIGAPFIEGLYSISNTGFLRNFFPGYTGGGLTYTTASNNVAIDPNDNVWVLGGDQGNVLSKFSSAGAPLTGSSGITGNGLGVSGPPSDAGQEMIVDGSGSVWVTNGMNNTLSKFFSDGTAALQSPFTNIGYGFAGIAPLSEPLSSLAADGQGNIWLANLGGTTSVGQMATVRLVSLITLG